MYPIQIPFLVSSYFISPYSYPVQQYLCQYGPITDNLEQGSNSKKFQTQIPKENGSESSKIIHKEKKIKKCDHRFENKKVLNLKHKRTKDEDFKHRQQTSNRNLKSNTLKMYFKQIREPNSQTFQALYKIINKFQPTYEPSKFIKDLDRFLLSNKNYISFNEVKKLCLKGTFGKILRISMQHFFEKQIYCVGIHSARTTRKIRIDQIKKGKQFIKLLNLQNL